MVPTITRIWKRNFHSANALNISSTPSIETSSNGSIFRVTGPLWGEFTGHQWIPRTKANDAELLMFSLTCAWINGRVNNREAGDLRRHRAHYEVIVIFPAYYTSIKSSRSGHMP